MFSTCGFGVSFELVVLCCCVLSVLCVVVCCCLLLFLCCIVVVVVVSIVVIAVVVIGIGCSVPPLQMKHRGGGFTISEHKTHCVYISRKVVGCMWV